MSHPSWIFRFARLVEDLRGYVVKLPKHNRYAPVLKNSVAMIEIP